MNKIPTAHRWCLALLAFAGLMILCCVSLGVMHAYPFSSDEYAYLYQAQIFSTGHLSIPINPRLHDLFELCMVYPHAHLFSKYPPGCSFFLLAGVKLGMPWLVNPLMSAGTLMLIYLVGLEYSGSSLGSLLALSMIITNVYFLGYGASYYAQVPVLFLTSLAFFLYQRYKLSKRAVFFYAAALTVSCATLVRPLDAFCLWCILCWDVIYSERSAKQLLLFCLLSAIGAAALMGYNAMLTGHWTVGAYNVFNSDYKLMYGHKGTPIGERISLFWKIYAVNLRDNKVLFTQYFALFFIGWVPFLVAGFKSFRRLPAFYGLLFVFLYSIHHMNVLGWPQYGSRYWYPLILPLGLWLIAGIRELLIKLPRWLFTALLGLCLAGQIGQAVYVLHGYAQRYSIVQKMHSDIDEHCPQKSIVVLNSPGLIKDVPFAAVRRLMPPAFIYLCQLKRNPFLKESRLLVCYPTEIHSVQSLLPDYSVCKY